MKKLLFVSTLLLLLYNGQGQSNEKFLKLQRIVTIDSSTNTNDNNGKFYIYAPNNQLGQYVVFTIKVPDSSYWKITTLSFQLNAQSGSMPMAIYIGDARVIQGVKDLNNSSSTNGIFIDKSIWVKPGYYIRFTVPSPYYSEYSSYLTAEEYRLEE